MQGLGPLDGRIGPTERDDPPGPSADTPGCVSSARRVLEAAQGRPAATMSGGSPASGGVIPAPPPLVATVLYARAGLAFLHECQFRLENHPCPPLESASASSHDLPHNATPFADSAFTAETAAQHQAELNDYLQSKNINQLFIQVGDSHTTPIQPGPPKPPPA